MVVNGESLYGAWRLEAMEHRLGDGPWEAARPVSGRILYDRAGYVAVVIIVHQPDGALPAAPAGDECIAYSGRFEVADRVVRHHIDVSFHTPWVAATQERYVEMDGDRLVLITAPFESRSGPRQSRLKWVREGGAAR